MCSSLTPPGCSARSLPGASGRLARKRVLREVTSCSRSHHEGFPLVVEVHTRPHWVDGLPLPPVKDLFEVAIESVVQVPGISALPPAHHSVLLAAHTWAHEPLGSLRDLIDIAAARRGTMASEADALAAAWGLQRIWQTTGATVDALLFGARRPWPLRVWARSLGGVRERTVLENHLERWLAGFSAFPPIQAARAAVRAVNGDARPFRDEDWPAKLRRTRTAIKNAFVRRSRHDSEVESALVGSRGESEDRAGGDPRVSASAMIPPAAPAYTKPAKAGPARSEGLKT